MTQTPTGSTYHADVTGLGGMTIKVDRDSARRVVQTAILDAGVALYPIGDEPIAAWRAAGEKPVRVLRPDDDTVVLFRTQSSKAETPRWEAEALAGSNGRAAGEIGVPSGVLALLATNRAGGDLPATPTGEDSEVVSGGYGLLLPVTPGRYAVTHRVDPTLGAWPADWCRLTRVR